MITLPTQLANFMKGKDLAGLKPFALLYRNKWNSVTEKYELDTTPIDISAHITKPNTLSMTLDVNEVAQYNANNVTLSLSDTKNQFVEGTPESYFPAGYQIYGSKVVLYYGITSPINPYPTQVGYTVVGTPTISENGVVSDFATSSFLATPPFNPGANPWELVFEFTTGTTFKSQGVMTKIGNVKGLTPLYINSSGNMAIWASSNGTVEDIANSVIYGPCAANTTYRIKQKFTGTNYKIYLWENNSWSLKKTINSSMPIYGNTPFAFGNNGGNTSPFRGTINIKNTYVKINGEYWFNGAHFFWKNNSTPLFTGVIKELPAHKPDKYQVDLKLVSPLEMLKDIEAKDFSDKVTGEELTYKDTDTDGNKIYTTSFTSVGGVFDVYADGDKLYNGVDYEVSSLNLYQEKAEIKIINPVFFNSVIVADYFVWKKNLTIEEIVAGLAEIAGYSGEKTAISRVVWTNAVRSYITNLPVMMAIGYYRNSNSYIFNWFDVSGNKWENTFASNETRKIRQHILPENFETEFDLLIDRINYGSASGGVHAYYMLGSDPNGTRLNNGMRFVAERKNNGAQFVLGIDVVSNGQVSLNYWEETKNTPSSISYKIKFRKVGTSWNWYINNSLVVSVQRTGAYNTCNADNIFSSDKQVLSISNQKWRALDENGNQIGPELYNPSILTGTIDKGQSITSTWGSINATLEGVGYVGAVVYLSADGISFSEGENYDLKKTIAKAERYIKFVLEVTSMPNEGPTLQDINIYYLDSSIRLQIVNLGTSTVLEALQDLALISGYEFGVDRQGVFFFRPRLSSTLPVYVLDHSELAKVDSVKKNLSDFFTKLTLTFAQVPLEFYANTGARPTPIDKYGVINKEIDKPDIVNYDNPELAQAIGPQLLEVYSALPNIIQATGKLNLALELADIVSLRRNYNLIADPEGTEFEKYINQQTYYRACKITGLNYNFSKKQITYTLRDVTDSYPNPQPGDLYEFVYDLPIRLGVK